MKNILFTVLLIIILTACISAQPDITDIQNNAATVAWTSVALTLEALPTSTPPPTATATPMFIEYTPSPLPFTPPTAISTSPYEADHEAIRKVLAAYFDKLYYMHNSFQVEGLDDLISSKPDGRSFLKTELRKQAVDIVWARLHFLRYASYNYTLNYSEIVVFDAGQSARANFTEENGVTYEISMPNGIYSQTSGIKHITILRKEQDVWKIIYDVHDDQSHRSLYAPTPLPADVLNTLDKTLISLSRGQGGPVLPTEGNAFILPDSTQLERWKEYETALAKKLMPQYPLDTVLCEWELTEKNVQKMNVWAMCMTTVTSANVGNYYFPVASVPAVINLNSDGTIQSINIPEYGNRYLSDLHGLFPNGAWKDYPNVSAMEEHLHWRRVHPNEPPLVVLNATATPTP